jgi:Protein of unknown function (DUF3105)
VTRLLAVLAGALLLAAGVVGVVAVFGSHDDAQVSAATGPGRLEPDRGARHLRPGQHAEVPAGTLPTSGPHRPEPIAHDGRALTDDQILHALELGDVVLLYDAARPPGALRRLQRDVSGPFDTELAAAGQAVILARRAGAGPATALAWRRDLRVADPAAPELRDFAEAWLGRGASG